MTHVCWTPNHVKRFIGSAVAEALDRQSPEEFFSRHVEMTLNGATADGSVVRDREYSEDEFLNEFLTAGAGRSSVLGAIIGESGHGKTHYLLWVEQKLRQKHEDHRRVIRIPRIKTSLPGIIKALIEVVPEQSRGEFHDIESKLTQYSNESVSDATLRLELAFAMTARLCREENAEYLQCAEELGGIGPIAARYVKDGKMLRLLSIHGIQKWLTTENGVIGRLVRSSIRPDGSDAPQEGVIQFLGEEIPASQWAEEFSCNNVEASLWRPFRNWPTEFAKLLNWGLEQAVRDFMAQRFSVHNPEDTVVQIRKAIHRAEPDVTIVLLMEDLANARYAEADLLNACTWEEEGLVPMRTLFATTTGLFRDLRLSVRQRITPSSSELPLLAFAGEAWNSRGGRPELEFAAKYLPVFRRSSDPEQQCSQCNQKDVRDAFGCHKDISFYPFSDRVLAHLASKVVDEKGAFHPRTFLRMVVNELVYAFNHIREGAFPSKSLDVAPQEAHPDVALFQKRMQANHATPEEILRATRIFNAYGKPRPDGRLEVSPLVWERFKVAASEVEATPELPPGDLAREKAQLDDCQSLDDIDRWLTRVQGFGWSAEAWRELGQAQASRRAEVGGRVPQLPPKRDGVKAWVAGRDLLPTDDERLKVAVANQVIECIDWAVLDIGPGIRESLVKGLSNIIVAGSQIQDGSGMTALHVKVEIPQDAKGFIEAREPYFWFHQIYSNQSRGQPSLGLPPGSDITNAEQYGRLADAHDYVRQSVVEQVEAIWGGYEKQIVLLFRSLVCDLASAEKYSVPLLPDAASVPGVLKWLRDLQKDGHAAVKVRRLLSHISSGKRDPYFADAFRVQPIVHALQHICEALEEPERLNEAKGSAILKEIRVEAPRVGELVLQRRANGQSVRDEASQMLRAFLGEDVDKNPRCLQVLAQKLKVVVEAMVAEVPDDGMRDVASSVALDFQECVNWLRQGDATYPEWAQTVRMDRQLEAKRLMGALSRVDEGIYKRKVFLERKVEELPDVPRARSRVQRAIDVLRSSVEGARGDV